MKIIYLWLNDFVENCKEITEQLSCEYPNDRIKVILTYDEELVWEMSSQVKLDNSKGYK